jgi:hypothetical protein
MTMIPVAMLGTVTATGLFQWVALERAAGKLDYITATNKQLAKMWRIKERAARDSLKALERSGWVAVDERSGTQHAYRLWPTWFPVDYVERDERDPGNTSAHSFISTAESKVHQRAKDWERFEDERERYRDTVYGLKEENPYLWSPTSSYDREDAYSLEKEPRWKKRRAVSQREIAMTEVGTKFPYVPVPEPVFTDVATHADFLVWTAMRSFLGPEAISASASTIGSLAGLTRETVTRSTKRLLAAGLLLPTEARGRKGTRVYTVPAVLSCGKIQAGNDLAPVIPLRVA